MHANAKFEPALSQGAMSEYFYDMLDQLLILGRKAGGDAQIDAALIAALLASRKT